MKPRSLNQIRLDHGFSLLELMTVVAIVSILSMIALPNLSEWVQASKLRSATQTLMSDLSMARMHAIQSYDSGGNGVKILFATGDYTIFIDSDNDNSVDVSEEVLKIVNYPSGVSMSACTFTGNRSVFFSTGSVSPAGSVTLSRDSGVLMKIIVNTVGRIRVENT